MSTKIYNGARVNLPTGNLLAFQGRMAETVRAVYEPMYLRLALSISFAVADGVDPEDFTNGEPVHHTGISPLYTAMSILDGAHRHVLATQQRHPLDLQLDVVFLDSGDPHRPLAIPYTERKPLLDAFNTLPEVEAYGYWDNVDQSDDVTDEEWEDRGRVWSTALRFGSPRHETPAQLGLTWSLIPSIGHMLFPQLMTVDELAPHLPGGRTVEDLVAVRRRKEV